MTLNLLGKTSEEDRIAYSSDASQIRGKVKEVLWPESADDVARIVKYCNEKNINLVTRGGGTGLVGGAVPDDSIVLDLSRMNKIRIEGKYAIAEPGVVLENLNTKIGDFFPVTTGSRKACTIGGMIATNAAGMRSLKYGKMEDWVEELEVIDGNGEKIKAGKEKIKDFCGREGTTGIIVNAKLRLREKPENVTMSILNFNDIEKVVEKVIELRKNKNVSIIEYVDRRTSSIAGIGDGYHLMVEYESNEGEIKGREMGKVWGIRESLYPLIASEGFIVIEDPEIPIVNIGKFLQWLEKNDIPTFGHISIGVVHPHFKKESPLIKNMFEVVESLKGNVTGEHGIGMMKKEFLGKEKVEEIKRLKKTYDNKGILNMGKVI